ncbi:hypothetical protein, partial [Staphylococcus aureus]|uniref:hypothetical protein n=1 Tax=Staphylococcus aureus TaxID=1280 RepID=UPI0032B4355C
TEGAQAELDARTLSEGSGVAVTGRLRSWFNPRTGRGGLKLIGKLVNRMEQGPQGREVPRDNITDGDDGELSS